MAASHKSPLKAQEEINLMADIWSPFLSDNPYEFVMYVFPWGKRGTPLEHEKGPKRWQKDILLEIGVFCRENKQKFDMGLLLDIFKLAVSSGRGIGKTTLLAWIVYWFMSTKLGGSVIVSANNEMQLKSRTWAEVGKWHTLAMNSHWFEKQALSLKPAPWFEELLIKQQGIDTGYYYAQAQLWSEENPDAFAGIHNRYGILVIFDESSGIPAPIWKVTEGFFTDPIAYRFHITCSNPRRNSGPFFECFHKFRKFWRTRKIDARTVEGTDPKVYQDIIERYGDDSDEARIEVKGEFPRTGDNQFISRALVEEAANRPLPPAIQNNFAPLLMGVDVARFGDDSTVIRFRQGRDARSIPPIVIKNMDNMFVANACAEAIDKFNPDAVFIDAGNGTGVIDRLKEMKYEVHEVWFGAESSKPNYANKRTEMWADMGDWLKGGCIDNSEELTDDLTGPVYLYRGQSDVKMLEPKDAMKKRGLASPDHGDALCVTFAKRIGNKGLNSNRSGRRAVIAKGVDSGPSDW